MKIEHFIDIWVTRFMKWFVYIAAFAVFFILVISVSDIIGYKVFDHGIPGTINIVQNLNVLLAFLVIPYVQLKNEHLTLNLLDKHTRVKRTISLISYVMGIFVSIFLSWRTFIMVEGMIKTSERNYGNLNFLLWPFGLTNFCGFVLLTIAFIFCFYREIKTVLTK